jgi:flagellar biosynthesis protein FlhB
LFSVLQTLLQTFRDVTKMSFTFKDFCSIKQHAYCAFVYKMRAASPESIVTKLIRISPISGIKRGKFRLQRLYAAK